MFTYLKVQMFNYMSKRNSQSRAWIKNQQIKDHFVVNSISCMTSRPLIIDSIVSIDSKVIKTEHLTMVDRMLNCITKPVIIKTLWHLYHHLLMNNRLPLTVRQSQNKLLHSKVVGTTTQSLQKLFYCLGVKLGVIHPYGTVWLIYK